MGQTNAEIVAGVYAAMKEADLDGILARCDPELTITQAEELPWGECMLAALGKDGPDDDR